jgi:hypothetical protein
MTNPIVTCLPEDNPADTSTRVSVREVDGSILGWVIRKAGWTHQGHPFYALFACRDGVAYGLGYTNQPDGIMEKLRSFRGAVGE